MWEISTDESYYGNYRNRKFTEIFPDYAAFLASYNETGFFDENVESMTTQLPLVYKLLFARYGNSTIASSDENQFQYKLFSILFQYGPAWVKKLEIQRELRNMNENDLTVGNTHIYNHSYNPSTDPSTATLDELPTINEQNVTKTKRSKLDQYELLLQLLKKDVTEVFINKFKTLFLTVVAPEVPLWYEEV